MTPRGLTRLAAAGQFDLGHFGRILPKTISERIIATMGQTGSLVDP